MKKAFVLVLAMILTLSMLCGCGTLIGASAGSSKSEDTGSNRNTGSNSSSSDSREDPLSFLKPTDPYEELCGTWTGVVQDSEEEALNLLEAIDAYEEEVAAADLDSLEFVKTVTFTEEKTYRFGYDIEGTKACVRRFLDQYFNDLYEVRSTLNDAYGMSFDGMSREEFLTFYAELYSYTYYDEMLDGLAENAYRYDELAVEDIETGTYTIDDDFIMCTITGELEAEGMEYHIKNDQLTLIYVNATEVYTRY